MKKVFELTNKYIILATPLILYTFISNTYMAISSNGAKVLNLIFAVILLLLMSAAFIAGWFNMVKLAVIDNENEPNVLIKYFTSGVGEYFLSSLGVVFMTFMVFSLALVCSYFLGINFVGDIGIPVEKLIKSLQSATELKAFISALSTEQLMKINLWNMLILGMMSFSYFLIMLYLPAMFFKTKNPFVAFFVSLKDLFSKKIVKSLLIFVLIFSVNLFLSLFSALFGANIFMHFVLTLMNFYFVTATSVGIFYYYYTNFIEIRLGQNVDVKI